jgi:hypothetical protein
MTFDDESASTTTTPFDGTEPNLVPRVNDR